MISIRGAITAENDEQSILQATETLISAVLEKNKIAIEDIISILFTATRDLTKIYPAAAARKMGITSASLMCMQEMHVEGSLQGCIRIMVLAESTKPTTQASHVYLKGAEILRPDLVQ